MSDDTPRHMTAQERTALRDALRDSVEVVTGEREGEGLWEDQRQTCKVCRRPDKFNFHVPDDLWREVVPERFSGRVVCLYCFDEFAAERGVRYAGRLRELCFAGDRASFIFRVESCSDG